MIHAAAPASLRVGAEPALARHRINVLGAGATMGVMSARDSARPTGSPEAVRDTHRRATRRGARRGASIRAENGGWNGHLLLLGLPGGALIAALLATVATGVDTIPGLPEVDPMVRFGIPIVRVLFNLAALATVGLSILPKLLDSDRPKLTAPIIARADRALVATASGWLAAALLSSVLHTAELTPNNEVNIAALGRYLTGVPAGIALLTSAFAALVSAGLALLTHRYPTSLRTEVRALPALLGLLPLPLTGHATTWRLHTVGMLSLELHVLTAALWTGGLLALALYAAPRRGLLATALPRFSRLATVAICTVALSGAVNAGMDLFSVPNAGPAALVTTGYGWIILAKVGCMAIAAVVGAHVRSRLLPRITRHQRIAILGWLALELGILGVAYGFGAVLARAPVIS